MDATIKEYLEWCEKNNLNPKNGDNLKKFMKEKSGE